MVTNAYFEASSGLAAAASSAFGTLSTEMAEQNRTAALIAFGVAKAAALAQVVIDTAEAVSSVNAAWAWNPAVGQPLAARAIATGIAQGAIIAAEKPTFHTGGLIGAGSRNAPDEVTIRAQAGEAVLNRRAAARLGESGVNALNSGGGAGGGVVVVNQYKHKVYDAFMSDHLKLPDSAVRKAIAGKTRTGHRAR